MLIDLLNSQNYIMVNIDAVRILGLHSAIYCAELLNVYKKAYIKEKLTDDEYFIIDRDFIESRTSLVLDDQLKCDLNLIKIGIIKRKEENPDLIYFDIEAYASLLSSEDVKLLNKVSKQIKSNPRGVKETKKERILVNLKNSIKCSNEELLEALRGWVDTICAKDNGYLSCAQIELFKNTLDKFTQGDLDLALEIVNIATVHGYRDCQWAINYYNNHVKNQSNFSKNIALNGTRTTEQKRLDINDLGDQKF